LGFRFCLSERDDAKYNDTKDDDLAVVLVLACAYDNSSFRSTEARIEGANQLESSQRGGIHR